MICYICNKTLSPTEIQYNQLHEDWDPCGTCLEVIDEVFSDRTEDEITEELKEEWPEDFPDPSEEKT